MNRFMNMTTKSEILTPAAGLRVRTQVHAGAGAGVLTFSGDDDVAFVVTTLKKYGLINFEESQNNLISLTDAGRTEFTSFLNITA